MASFIDDGGGKYRISFKGSGGRKTIYLADFGRTAALAVHAHVETIVAAAAQGVAIDAETAAWLGSRPEAIYAKLVNVGLVPPRDAKPDAPPPATLGPWLTYYIDSRSDVKPRTRTNLDQARKHLLGFFAAERPLDSITPGDADEYRRFLLTKVGENTARRHCGRAKQFFRAAVRKRLIVENPFADMKRCQVKANPALFHFITRDDAAKILDACPDAQWRLIFALSRFGGLRCPSETLGLRWEDINWERNRILIHSPKTAHHEGGESRFIPIFPELRPYLEEAWELAGQGEFVITRYRDAGQNLRTQFKRIVEKKAGLKAWPKLFQNLRSTRETELAQEHPMHVVCAWLGNSQPVAAKHYLQVTDADFDRAAAGSAFHSARGPETAHFAAQPTLASLPGEPSPTRRLPQRKPQGGGYLDIATDSHHPPSPANLPFCSVPPEGLEPSTH